MTLEKNAGPCVEGKRQHRWGERTNRRALISRIEYDVPCLRCARVQLYVFGKRGNRVAGYFTRTEP